MSSSIVVALHRIRFTYCYYFIFAGPVGRISELDGEMLLSTIARLEAELAAARRSSNTAPAPILPRNVIDLTLDDDDEVKEEEEEDEDDLALYVKQENGSPPPDDTPAPVASSSTAALPHRHHHSPPPRMVDEPERGKWSKSYHFSLSARISLLILTLCSLFAEVLAGKLVCCRRCAIENIACRFLPNKEGFMRLACINCRDVGRVCEYEGKDEERDAQRHESRRRREEIRNSKKRESLFHMLEIHQCFPILICLYSSILGAIEAVADDSSASEPDVVVATTAARRPNVIRVVVDIDLTTLAGTIISIARR